MSATSDVARPTGVRGFWLGFAAYLLPSFPIAFVWHLVLFEQKYHALQIYRDEPVIALWTRFNDHPGRDLLVVVPARIHAR